MFWEKRGKTPSFLLANLSGGNQMRWDLPSSDIHMQINTSILSGCLSLVCGSIPASYTWILPAVITTPVTKWKGENSRTTSAAPRSSGWCSTAEVIWPRWTRSCAVSPGMLRLAQSSPASPRAALSKSLLFPHNTLHTHCLSPLPPAYPAVGVGSQGTKAN